ncbi:MAG TPA: DNA repair protein RecO, partial [Gammaproteobacteria bacterium]|nr:DNA repair protein RecO [Gammaproteobacteria bacterium]
KNLFNEYCMLLGKLESVCQGVDEIRIFELRLLEELGYGINFEFDAGTGSRIEGNLTYRYVLNEGFYRVEETRSEFFSGKELLAIANRRLNNVDRNRLRNLTRSSLSVLLGDKPLKSRDLFREISQ